MLRDDSCHSGTLIFDKPESGGHLKWQHLSKSVPEAVASGACEPPLHVPLLGDDFCRQWTPLCLPAEIRARSLWNYSSLMLTARTVTWMNLSFIHPTSFEHVLSAWPCSRHLEYISARSRGPPTPHGGDILGGSMLQGLARRPGGAGQSERAEEAVRERVGMGCGGRTGPMDLLAILRPFV